MTSWLSSVNYLEAAPHVDRDRDNPAKQSLGDCFAYAPAKARKEPLLFKSEDVRVTEVETAI